MSKNKKLTFVIVAATIVLSSCGLDIGGDTYNVPATTDHGVTVQATGAVKVVPDGVQFNFSVFAVELTSAQALARASASAGKAREALDNLNIDKKDIATQNVSVYPEYTYSQDGKQTLTGFRATQSFATTLRDTEKAGAVVDAVVMAVSTDLTIDSLNPILLDTKEATAQARKIAIKSARDKAEDYSDLLDVKLGEVVFLHEVSAPNFLPQTWMREATTSDEATKTVVDLGTQEVSVTVEVRWAIKN